MQKITTFLWFDKEAEEAAKFYTSIFSDSRIKEVSRYGEAGPGPKGSVMVVTLELQGQEFMLLNGGPEYKFTEAISFMINCDSQEEIDRFWARLTDGGEEGAMRLAEGQVRSFLAGHAQGATRDAEGPGSRTG